MPVKGNAPGAVFTGHRPPATEQSEQPATGHP